MAIGNLLAISSHGLFSTGGGGTCDYPSADDVRDGVQYDFGSLTGDLVLPDEDDVLLGTGYGANGTEFTGSLDCLTPPTPVPPSSTSSPFASIALAIKQRLILMLGINEAWVKVVANDHYKVTVAEPFFVYVRIYGVTQPRDPGLEFVNAGAGRLFRPLARRVRIYVYIRSGVDTYGDDSIALFGPDSAMVSTSPTAPYGMFLAEELVMNALDDWTPLNGDPDPSALTVTPLHQLDSSEEPERPMEDEMGLLRACLDFEAVYGSAIDPTEPPA